jgi:hypothetical protein
VQLWHGIASFMSRTLDQVLSELNPYYAGSESSINSQISAIPGETDAAVSGLDAKLAKANTGIVDAARRRGTGVAFGGIPIAEQAQYAATDYAPALANLKTAQTQKGLTLQESLQQLGREKLTNAQGIVDSEASRELQQQSLAEQIRQFNENLAFQKKQAAAAASTAGIGSYLGGGNTAATKLQVQTTPEEEGDAKYVGNLATAAGKDPESYVQVIQALRSSKNAVSQRRYALGKQLGYWQ